MMALMNPAPGLVEVFYINALLREALGIDTQRFEYMN